MADGNKLMHLDRRGEVTLILHKKRAQDDKYRWDVVTQEWLPGKLRKLYGDYFKPVPFFSVSRESFNEACRVLDKYILETFPEDIVHEYEVNDKIPEELMNNVPLLMKPFWNTLTMVNQNQRCTYLLLKSPIEGHEGVDVRLWSGHKVISPFTSDMDNYYNTMKVIGAPGDIDKFIREFKP